jgi:hypothetical protein
MTTRDIDGLPDAKHQKVGGPERKFSNSVADPVEAVAVEPPKPVTKSEVQVPSKAPEIITVSDSSDAEEESEEEESENLETCTVCGKEYDGDDEEQECLTHDGTLISPIS